MDEDSKPNLTPKIVMTGSSPRPNQSVCFSSNRQRRHGYLTLGRRWRGPKYAFASAVGMTALPITVEPGQPNSFSNSFRCRCTSSTSNPDTDGLPPYSLLRVNATRFKSSQMSAGRLMPVVRCVRSTTSGARGVALALGCFRMSGLSLAHSTSGNCALPGPHKRWCLTSHNALVI